MFGWTSWTCYTVRLLIIPVKYICKTMTFVNNVLIVARSVIVVCQRNNIAFSSAGEWATSSVIKYLSPKDNEVLPARVISLFGIFPFFFFLLFIRLRFYAKSSSEEKEEVGSGFSNLWGLLVEEYHYVNPFYRLHCMIYQVLEALRPTKNLCCCFCCMHMLCGFIQPCKEDMEV